MPPDGFEVTPNSIQLISKFIKSRRQGLSKRTIDFYNGYLYHSLLIIGTKIKGQDIIRFLNSLCCTNGGKRAYFSALRAFYNWLYSPKSGVKLNYQDNPILAVDPPKVEKRILPSLSVEQVEYLIGKVDSIRDKAIISLFADSGLRLSELASIKQEDINWDSRLIKVKCKGNKEGFAVFGSRTEKYLKEWLNESIPNGSCIWKTNRNGIEEMLKQLKARTGLPCNAHTFRRTFASILAKRGVDSLHIMRLGRWECLAMVERYTRSVKFEDSLKLYSSIVS